MRKLFAKILALALGATIAFTATGCGLGPQVEQEGDPTKTILRIGNIYSGLRDEWLTTIEKSFESKYEGISFEDDKTGVDIVIDNNGSYNGTKVMDSVDKNDVWFTYMLNYNELVSRGLAMDITEVVTGDLGEVEESEAGVTIESKLSKNIKDDFKAVGGGKYYALPFYETYYGIVYDVDFFESEGFYFAKDFDRTGSLANMFVISAEDDRSCGPDGDYGTWDDGLPETYEDFYNLCRYIKACTMTPLSYPGQFVHYWTRYLFQVWADYEGADQMMLNFTLNGTAKNLVEIKDGDLVEKDDIGISATNAYELQGQAGKYYALQFANTLAKNKNWFSTSSSGTGQSQEMNQKEFLYSKKASSRIAMCLDGSWFNCESSSTYTDMVNGGDRSAGRYTRKIGFMPIPKATSDKVGETLTFVDSSRSACFIRSGLTGAKATVAKLFMKYFHNNESLAVWTEKTETTRPFNYTVDSTKLSHFGNMMMDIHNNSNVIFQYSNNKTFLQNAGIFDLDTWAFSTIKSYSNPFVTFRDTNTSINDYFNGMYSTQKASIQSLIK